MDVCWNSLLVLLYFAFDRNGSQGFPFIRGACDACAPAARCRAPLYIYTPAIFTCAIACASLSMKSKLASATPADAAAERQHEQHRGQAAAGSP
jgi:hypothetical protein